MLSKEATNINFIVFGLIRSGFEPTIYLTRDQYANYYTTDAVLDLCETYDYKISVLL